MVRWLALCLLLAAGCGDDAAPVVEPTPPPPEEVSAEQVLAAHRVEWPAEARATAIQQGREAIERHQCNRCHTIDDIEPTSRPTHCVSCHAWLKNLPDTHRTFTKLAGRYGEDVIRRYQRNIEHWQRVPDLTNIGQRLRPAWIGEYIASPWDLRPAMDETMVRTTIPEADLRAIVRYFAAVASVADPYGDSPERVRAPPRPDAARLAAAEELFGQRCAMCHVLGNRDGGRTAEELAGAGMAAKLAPNLRFSRDRLYPDVLVAWVQDPQAFVPDTLMPDMALTREQAELLRDFIWHADPRLVPPPEPASEAPPPVLERPVGWEEVKDRVLGATCVHCHMNDHERDLGPGNDGGYGWPGNQLQMRTYERLVHGAVDRDGTRYSVLVPREGHEHPPLVEAMLARRPELRRDLVPLGQDHERQPHPQPDRLGMPMGLPSMTDEQISLVRTWIAQGCPGPPEVTGMPGIYDGFLVPDGPIEQNRGCELRAPATRRPEWAIQPPPPWHDMPPRPGIPPPRPETPAEGMEGG